MTFLFTFSTLIFDFPLRDTLHASRNTSDERQATSDEFALFCAFVAGFCAFYASLWLKRTVFTRLLNMANNHSSLILNHLYGLHSFAFYILIFDFFPQSLTPTPQSLPPDPWPLPPNVIVHKYLRAEKLLYNCRELSTSVESSLQINLFMQNKANFQKVKFDVTKVLTKDYDQLDTWSIRKTKPIQSQFKAN